MTYSRVRLPEEGKGFSEIKSSREEVVLPKEYKLVTVPFDWSQLSKSDMAVVRELWKAIEPVDRVFTEQKAPGTTEIIAFLEEVKKYADEELAKKISSYVKLVKINHSIFDAANGDSRIEPGFKGSEILEVIEKRVPIRSYGRLMEQLMSGIDLKLFTPFFSQRPDEGGLYVGSSGLHDIPREFFKRGEEGKRFREKLINEFPPEERERIRKGLNSPTNIVVFKDGKPVEFIPYSKYFEKETKVMREVLRKAAEAAEDTASKDYLIKRSDDIMQESCRKSDIAWLGVTSRLSVVIGDVETYNDKGVGVRRDAGIVIYYRDDEKTKKIQKMREIVPELERRLPVIAEVKNLGRKPPVTDVAYTLHNAGQEAGPASAVAFNLPNDREVIREYGARAVMLLNAIEGKAREREVPMVRLLMDKDMISSLNDEDIIHGSFVGFLLHEWSHASGRLKNSLRDKGIDIHQALGSAYPTIEEAKADIVGLYDVPYLVEKGLLTERERDMVYISAVAHALFSMRQGVGAEAHIDARALEVNYLLESGGIVRNVNGTYRTDREKFEHGIASLSEKLLAIETEGSAEEAKKLIDRYVKVTPETVESLARAKDLPKVIVVEYPELPA